MHASTHEATRLGALARLFVLRWQHSLVGAALRDLLLEYRARRSRFGARGQGQPESTALADVGLHIERATQQLGESTRDRKSQARAFLQLSFAELYELLEDAIL